MSRPRVIDVRKQKNLALSRMLGLCVRGIAHRLLRSVLTLAVVVLAVAFFMFLLAENAFLGATAKGVWKEASQQRLAPRLLNHLFNAPSGAVLSRRLGSRAATLAEYAAVSGWDPDRVRRLARACRREQEALRFFEEIPVGKRVILAQKRRGREIFRFLADPREMEVFAERIKPMPDLRLPGGMPGFAAFVVEFPRHEAELAAFAAAWRKGIDAFSGASAALTGGAADIESWIVAAPPAQLEAWGELVRSRGFRLESTWLASVRKQLEIAQHRQKIVRMLSSAEKRAAWGRAFRQSGRMSIGEKIGRLDDDRVVAILDEAYSRDRLAEVSAAAAYERRLAALEQKLTGRVDSERDGRALSTRQAFLLFISFVVCMVGIANAMLMSITERFREIATLKCLGATDRYVLIQFMLEAALHGIAGGALGMVIGFAIALAKSAIGLGSYVFAYWPGQDLGVSAVASLAAGVLLAVLASMYPSWAASRMVPMEAMRIE